MGGWGVGGGDVPSEPMNAAMWTLVPVLGVLQDSNLELRFCYRLFLLLSGMSPVPTILST